MEKIPLFKKRNLGETIGTAFELMRVNFRLISVSFLIMVMPLLQLSILLMSMGLIGFLKQKATYYSSSVSTTAATLNTIAIFIGYFGYFFTLFIEAVVLHEVIIAYEHSDDPGNIKVADVWKLIKGDLGRIILSFLGLIPLSVLLLILTVVIYAVAASISTSATGLSILIIYLLYVYINVCMSNYLMLRLRSEYNVYKAITKSFSLTVGKWRWWRTLGVHFVTMIPFGIIIYLLRLHFLSDLPRDQSVTYASLFTGVSLLYAGSVFAYCINLILLGSTANYYSLVEEKEHVGLQVDIGQIGIAADPTKKQEGEY